MILVMSNWGTFILAFQKHFLVVPQTFPVLKQNHCNRIINTILRWLFKCISLELISDPHIPSSLHTYCLKCLLSNQKNDLSCPHCTAHEIPKGGVANYYSQLLKLEAAMVSSRTLFIQVSVKISVKSTIQY